MSEFRRRRTQEPQLMVPQREDAALDAEAQRLEQAAARQAEMASAANQQPIIPAESPVRTAEEENAYNLGQKMGAQSIASQISTPAGKEAQGYINEERLIEAEQLLMRYKAGKASVDRRIINAQDWWKMRNWDQIENARGTRGATEIKSGTAWLWNCICGKHADAMDSFPEPVILPRMVEDKAEAQILSDILPVILSINGFEETYSQAQWQKFQEGTGGYYVGWDKMKLGGIGDIAIRNINLLNLYWEPGIEDIQDSENLFYINIVNTKTLEQQYPQLKGKLKNAYLKPAEYRKDDSVSDDGKSVLVDWYYKTWSGPKQVLHYCQFVNHEILYSTENSGMTEGLYEDGEYPFILDALYPVHGSPAGYGMIDIARDAQTDIDTLNQAMVQNAVVTSTPRYFIVQDGVVNEDEFADWSKPFVHSQGMLGDTSLRQIETSGIQSNALNMLERKIEEIKFITGNSDVNNGSAPSGVTAASAIAALQEVSGRSSKDSSRSSYRATNKLYNMCIERIRQFYDMPRQFRILGQNGQEKFVTYSNAKLKEQQIMGGMGLAPGLRKPVFDIDVRSERESAYTRISQNELALQFMQMGVFNPQMTDQSLMMLDMMDFKGKEELMAKVANNGTLMQSLMQVGQIAMALSEKYDPAVAQQLAPVLQNMGMDAGMQQTGGGAPVNPELLAGADAMVNAPSEESAGVRKARRNVQESTRPE